MDSALKPQHPHSITFSLNHLLTPEEVRLIDCQQQLHRVCEECVCVCVCVCVECDTGIWSPGEFGGGCMFLQLTRPPIFT